MVPDQFRLHVLDLRHMVCKTDVKMLSTWGTYKFFSCSKLVKKFGLIYVFHSRTYSYVGTKSEVKMGFFCSICTHLLKPRWGFSIPPPFHILGRLVQHFINTKIEKNTSIHWLNIRISCVTYVCNWSSFIWSWILYKGLFLNNYVTWKYRRLRPVWKRHDSCL